MSDFAGLSAALARAGLDRPTLVLDRAALDANLAHLAAHLPAGYARRVADKSLPAPDLLAAVMAGLGTERVMSFDLRLTARVLAAMPGAQVMMGKPAPVGQAAAFLRDVAGADRVIWLIDSAARAAQYAALRPDLPVAYEVDIGLGRAGLPRPPRWPGWRPRGSWG